jgi:hypothetical protein
MRPWWEKIPGIITIISTTYGIMGYAAVTYLETKLYDHKLHVKKEIAHLESRIKVIEESLDTSKTIFNKTNHLKDDDAEMRLI